MEFSGHRDCAGSGGAHAQGSPCRQCHRDPAIPSVGITVVPGTASPVVYFYPRDGRMKPGVQAPDSKNPPCPGKDQGI